MSAVCTGCDSSLNAEDIFCGNCGRAAGRPVPEAVPPYEPVPAAWFSLSSAPELDRARVGPLPPEEPDQWPAAAQDLPAPPSYPDPGAPPTLDPLFSPRFLWPLARRFVFYSVVAAVVDVAVVLLSLIFSVLGRGLAVAAVAPVVGGLSIIVLLLAFWLLPVPALLGQWSRLLSFQAPAARTALDCVAGALDRHATPSDKLGIRPISPPGEGRRHYLELRRGYFAGYVSCFPHGHDLYVGWSFWICISPLRVLLMRMGQDHRGHRNNMDQRLGFESARATVAAIHACTLEGVDVATGGAGEPPVA